MPKPVNSNCCIYNHDGVYCDNENVKRSFFGIGSRLCVLNHGKKCEFQEKPPCPINPPKAKGKTKMFKENLKESINQLELDNKFKKLEQLLENDVCEVFQSYVKNPNYRFYVKKEFHDSTTCYTVCCTTDERGKYLTFFKIENSFSGNEILTRVYINDPPLMSGFKFDLDEIKNKILNCIIPSITFKEFFSYITSFNEKDIQ